VFTRLEEALIKERLKERRHGAVSVKKGKSDSERDILTTNLGAVRKGTGRKFSLVRAKWWATFCQIAEQWFPSGGRKVCNPRKMEFH